MLLGVHVADSTRDAEWIANKVAKLRIFPDDQGVMNRSIVEAQGSVLAVSQFTLYGDASKGNRPSYIEAARGEVAQPIYDSWCARMRSFGIPVSEGVFGADMDVALTNWGPVTIVLDSKRTPDPGPVR